jgi:hypothetical protein
VYYSAGKADVGVEIVMKIRNPVLCWQLTQKQLNQIRCYSQSLSEAIVKVSWLGCAVVAKKSPKVASKARESCTEKHQKLQSDLLYLLLSTEMSLFGPYIKKRLI